MTQREALRQERSKPILIEIHAWLLQEKSRVLPKSPIGEAIGYALNHWQASSDTRRRVGYRSTITPASAG